MQRKITLLLMGLIWLGSQIVQAQCTPGALDSDADGICDIEDLDDDNDGILDSRETVCSANLSNFTFYGQGVSSVDANTIYLTSNGAWRTSYSNDTLSLPIHLEYRGDRSNYKMIGLLPLGANENINKWNDGAYKLYTHQNNYLYGKLINQWSFTLADFDTKLLELDIDEAGKLTVTMEGVVIYTRNVPVSDYRLAVSSNNGGVVEEFKITYKQTPCNTQDIDTDGDGTPNRLDLDSDGDSCADAFEGDGGFGLNDMDGNGRLIGGIDTNPASPTYGAPIVVDTLGQGVGESTTASFPLVDFRECKCLAANNPTDTDGDGICNEIDICDNVPDNLIGTPCNDGNSNTINDVWDGTACACVGTPTCTPGALDSDADGICDIEDLDDDNDGILDENETVCSSLSDLTMYGNAIDSILPDRILLTNNGGWRSSYSEDTLSLPFHLEFLATTDYYRQIGFLPVNLPGDINIDNDGSYKLYSHINGRIYGRLPNSWTFQTVNTHNKMISMDVDISGNVNVLMEGDTIYTGTMLVTDYHLAVSSYNGGSFEDIVLSYANMPCTVQDLDTDGDGTPNRLDLDSDGDRCVDAFEGDSTFGLNDMDADGRLTGGIDSNQGSATYGVPLSAGTAGQGIGESTNPYTPLIDIRECICIASNNPTDADNDGICDDIDACANLDNNLIGTPCNDGDNTTVSDVWTIGCNCLGVTACTPGDLDSDTDGICDLEDLDDDNDGIPDKEESICTVLPNLSMYGNAVDTIDADSIVLLVNGAWRSSYSSDILSLPLHLDFMADIETLRMIGFLPLGLPETVNNWNDASYKIYINPNGNMYAKVPTEWTYVQGGIDGKRIDLDIDVNGNLSVKVGGAVVYTGTAPVSDYRFVVTSHSGGTFKGVTVQYGNLPCIEMDSDSDADGTPNRLDLDSDDDICVDAFEGDGTFGLNDMDSNGQLTGSVDMTQGSPAYGIPLSAGSGQGAGESTAASFPLVETRECMCIASNNPVDTDNDGVCDAIDLCPNIDDNLIGTPCDDGDVCTVNDVWKNNCECAGIFVDSDGDQICDVQDTCPDFDDAVDMDNDGITDCLDACIDVNDNDVCDNAEMPFTPDDDLLVAASRRRGYYTQPFNLDLLANNPNANIYYTLDGSEPDATTQLYDGTPIPVDSTTVVRVISYAGSDTSKIVTFSYLFADYMIEQPDTMQDYPLNMEIDASVTDDPYFGQRMIDAIKCIPTVSIVMDIDDFNAFYYEKEIQSPVSIELLYPDGTDYQQNGGVEAYGNSTFGQAKKNFRFLFKQEFGESKFRYPIFGEDAADDFDYWVLRAGGQETTNRGGAQNLNDQVFRDLQLTTSGSASHGDFFHVTVNGKYWGVYNAAERPQKSFGESYFGGDKDDWNTMKGTCCDVNERAIDGDLQTYDKLAQNINDLDSVAKYLDIDHYIDYVMINNYGPHGDWRTWNTYAVDNPVIGEPIRFFVWDAEPSMASDWYYITTDTRTIDMNDIYDPLMAQLEFRVDTGDHMECHCFNEGPLTPVKVKELYQYWFDKTEKAFLWETGRWQGIDTYEKFVRYRDRVFAHIDARTDTLIVRYRAEGLYPSIDAVQFSQYGGAIPNGFSLNMTNPNSSGTIYYTTDGTDPRLDGGGISPTAQVYNGSMSLSGVTTIKARVFDGTEWSAMCPRRFYGPQNYQDVVINEIMYHPDSLCAATDSTELDYIELHNAGSQAVDLIDCKFTDGISYEFSDPMILQPGDFLVLAENIDEFVAVYGFAPYDQYKGGLDNNGEIIKIADPFDNLLDSVKYNDSNPWDEDPDGNGPSLELLNPVFDNADPISWFRSDNTCGTPAAPNSRVCTGTSDIIVINEINYNSNNGITDPGDWVELHNPNTNAVDISDWTFYDNGNEFIFPSGTTIQPDEYLVLVEDASMFTSIFPHLTANEYIGNFDFGLSNKGERISLFNKDKCLSDYVVYNDRIPWDTIPDGNGPTLSLIIPNVDNTLPQSWASSSAINSAYGTPGRTNTPCLENNILIPNPICAGFPTEIKVDSVHSETDFTWFASGATPFNFTTDSETLTWNNSGNYNLQLITKYYECTKVYTQPVTVTDCNTAPGLVNDIFSVNEDNLLSNNVLTNDNDAENNNFTINTTPQNPTSNGTLTINPDGTFDYTPNANFNGTDSFTYEVCDGAQTLVTNYTPTTFTTQVASGADDVEELSTDGSINTGSSDLDLLDDPPSLFSAVGIRMTNITIPQGATVTGAYLEFVADESQSVTTAINISAEAVGNALPIPTTVYSVSSKPRTTAATSWTSMPPWTTGDAYRSADIGAVVQELINRGDWSSGNAMTFILEGTGTRTAESFEGAVAPKLVINYQAATQSTADVSLCNTATVTINILPQNDPPQAVDNNLTIPEDTPATSNLLTNDSDIDGDNLTANATPITPPQNGSLTIQPYGLYSYTPNPNFFGTDSFEYEVCDDGSPSMCTTASVMLNITPVNDAPTPAPDTLYMFANSSIQHNVLLNDSDIENDNLVVAPASAATPNNASINVQSNGNIDYTPAQNFVGTDVFTYEACDDGTPSECSTGTVVIFVEPDCVDIQLFAWLEGAYEPTLGEMRTTLAANRKLLPGQTPASNLAIPTPAGQPYNGSPWNYAGTEGTSWTDADYTGDETDWVLASFRTGTAKSTEVGITAGLLMKDGSIEFPDRCALTSTVASPLYIVLEHRNHIGIMTPQPVNLIGSTLTYDFRLADSYRDPTSFGQKLLPTGEWTMFAGDADQSDFPSFDIKGTDKTVWFDNNGIFDYYFSPDFNLDGDINGQDKSLWFENNGISSRVPK